MEIPIKYTMVIAYFSNLIGLIVFISIIFLGLYFLIKVFSDLIKSIFGNDYKEDYD